MPLCDIKHQDRAQRLIQRAISADRFPHAYIFHGPDGIGKEMFAIAVAKLLLCESPKDVEHEFPMRDACGQCSNCHLVDVGNHPDLHLVHRQLAAHHPDSAVRARKALDLGVDVIRHFVIDAVGVKPVSGRFKVFVIREADRITPGAQNALLKTLEEPPDTTILILLASALDRLLATTRSRCQLVGFASPPLDFVASRLCELVEGLTQTDADLLAVLSQGSLGRAVTLAEDGFVSVYSQVAGMLEKLDRSSASHAAKQLVEMAKDTANQYRKREKNLSEAAARRAALADLLSVIATWYAGHLHSSVGRTPMLPGLGDGPDAETSAQAIDAISDAESRLAQNVHAPLCIEGLFFALAAPTVTA
ncbi:MAG: DNA polymerase III subunit [Planctomycetes bacterium]|nr:DNA polymerase III subunit [Planctomycetota bacterium]